MMFVKASLHILVTLVEGLLQVVHVISQLIGIAHKAVEDLVETSNNAWGWLGRWGSALMPWQRPSEIFHVSPEAGNDLMGAHLGVPLALPQGVILKLKGFEGGAKSRFAISLVPPHVGIIDSYTIKSILRSQTLVFRKSSSR